MRTREKRTLEFRVLLYAGVLCVGVAVFTGTASAAPNVGLSGTGITPVPLVASYQAVLDDLMGNLFDIVHVTAFYAGLTALMAGVILSFLGQRRGGLSLLGYSVGTGGAFLLLLYFGYEILFGLLRWTFKVGTW